ncbi:Protein C2-DOMAIN ABA-RELATED like [Actinidia chinensis var. chinensis]|uniref:Protein C2-DOMAIN ABA-RELATED like n=1 Tax=Actinidia chinensis var. chinensis TaxID=1590841 RepID=A0A2R6PTU8_ACTCC|nr:Protein C2-DOMAIN ABA-RELATED like [Actinidia chinensis var. chinensis]
MYTHSPSSSLMDQTLGLLSVRVKRGLNLAIRDVRSSDPYVVIETGTHKLKTHVIRKDANPVWNEDLSLTILDPNLPIKLTVYDHDTFSSDDKMGDAEFDLKAFVEAMKMDLRGLPDGTVVARLQPSRQNCLARESCITFTDGKVSQDLSLRLRNVECGEVELSLYWIRLPGVK